MKSIAVKEVLSTGTLRQLILKSTEFNNLVQGFEQWLRVFGFASSTVYYSPAYLRSFFHFLESFKKLTCLSAVTNNHIRAYMQYLSQRISLRTGRQLSQNYMLNHLNALKLFSKYMFESQGTLLDASFRYSRGSIGERNWLKKSDIEKLYDGCDSAKNGDMDRVVLSIYYGMGLRRMEGIGLDICDINRNGGLDTTPPIFGRFHTDAIRIIIMKYTTKQIFCTFDYLQS